MGTHLDKVGAQHLPYFGPDKADSCHVEVSHFNDALEAEFPGILGVRQFVLGNFAEILDEENDCILVQVYASLKDAIDLCTSNVLNHEL